MNQPKALNQNVNNKISDTICHLILFNDHVNEYNYIVNSLIEICNHTPNQAEQCTLIAHLSGKCHIKKDYKSILNSMNEQFISRNIKVELVESFN